MNPGDRYGLLVLGERLAGPGSLWRCQCDCGASTVVPASELRRTNRTPTQSCGCLSRKFAHVKPERHGRSNTVEHRIWAGIIKRCYNKKSSRYQYYGGRGISMCQRWLSSFIDFLQDVGLCPGPGYSLDRINNNGNYEPGNIRWATRTQQGRNTRHNHTVTVGSTTRALSEWAENSGIPYSQLKNRLRQGWHPVLALTLSPRRGKRRTSDHYKFSARINLLDT